MALTPIGMGTLFAGYGIGLTGWCWITGRDISLGQLWDPLHPVTKLPAKGTASPDVIIPDGKGGGTSSTGTAQKPLSATQTASGGGGGTSTNPLSGGLSGGSSGAGAATSASGGSSGGAVLTAAETSTGTSSTGGTKTTGGKKVAGGGVARTTAPKSAGSGEAGIGSPSGGGSGNAVPLPSGGGVVTPADIYRTLLKAGATPVQAAGLMGNIQNESSFNPEVQPGDSGTSFGLFQEHNKVPQSYLQTGNPQRDMVTQINFMVRNGGLRQAVGSTPAQVASNFAAGYEGCVGCAPGGSQNAERAANAANIYAQATRGNWGVQPKPPNVSTGGGNIPAWELKGSGLTEAQARALGRKGTKPATASRIAGLFPIVRPARGRIHVAPPKARKAPTRGPTGVRHLPPALTRPAAAAKAQGRVNPQSVASRY